MVVTDQTKKLFCGQIIAACGEELSAFLRVSQVYIEFFAPFDANYIERASLYPVYLNKIVSVVKC